MNKYDREMTRRGVIEIRYADDIVILEKSKRAVERFLNLAGASGRKAPAENKHGKSKK